MAKFTAFNEIIELDGSKLVATMSHDYDRGAPWEEEEGHGPVSGWRSKDSKQPGELVLHEDRGSARFYDFAEACRIALRDGWNAKPYDVEGETPKQRAAKAARADFEHLRAWCNGGWGYQVICVTAIKSGVKLADAYLGGVAVGDGQDEAYALECADELIGEALEQAKDVLDMLCGCKAA